MIVGIDIDLTVLEETLCTRTLTTISCDRQVVEGPPILPRWKIQKKISGDRQLPFDGNYCGQCMVCLVAEKRNFQRWEYISSGSVNNICYAGAHDILQQNNEQVKAEGGEVGKPPPGFCKLNADVGTRNSTCSGQRIISPFGFVRLIFSPRGLDGSDGDFNSQGI